MDKKEFKVNIPLGDLGPIAENLAKHRKAMGPYNYILSEDGRSVSAILVNEDTYEFLEVCKNLLGFATNPKEAAKKPADSEKGKYALQQTLEEAVKGKVQYAVVHDTAPLRESQDPILPIADFSGFETINYDEPEFKLRYDSFCNVIYTLDGGRDDVDVSGKYSIMRVDCPGAQFARQVPLRYTPSYFGGSFRPNAVIGSMYFSEFERAFQNAVWGDMCFVSANITKNGTSRFNIYASESNDVVANEDDEHILTTERFFDKTINRMATGAIVEILQYMNPASPIEIYSTRYTTAKTLAAANDLRYRRTLQDLIGNFSNLTKNVYEDVLGKVKEHICDKRFKSEYQNSKGTLEADVIDFSNQGEYKCLHISNTGSSKSSYYLVLNRSLTKLYILYQEGEQLTMDILKIEGEAVDLLYAMLTR